MTGTVVYTGVTNDLIRRVYEHKHNADPDSFTARYAVHKLVYFEHTSSRYAAISREKQIKSWSRKKKNAFQMVPKEAKSEEQACQCNHE